MDKLQALWLRIPPKWQKAITDFWTPVAAAVAAAILAFEWPADGNFKAAIFTAFLPVVNVVINALRRAVVKDIIGWDEPA